MVYEKDLDFVYLIVRCATTKTHMFGAIAAVAWQVIYIYVVLQKNVQMFIIHRIERIWHFPHITKC